MKTLISRVHRSLPAFFVVLFSVFAAAAQTTQPPPADAKTPPSDSGNAIQVKKNDDADTRTASPDEKRILSGKKARFNPQLTEEQLKDIQEARNEAIAAPAACTSTTPIAFSAIGAGHRSSGPDALIFYNKPLSDKIITNENGGSFGWLKPASFLTPCSGLYVLTISFQKDAYYPPATSDDVTMYLVRNLDTSDSLSAGYAWSGEGSPRTTGTYTVTYRLNQGDVINTWARSDGGYARHLIVYYFTAYRIAP